MANLEAAIGSFADSVLRADPGISGSVPMAGPIPGSPAATPSSLIWGMVHPRLSLEANSSCGLRHPDLNGVFGEGQVFLRYSLGEESLDCRCGAERERLGALTDRRS
jgi:hypothetical protein